MARKRMVAAAVLIGAMVLLGGFVSYTLVNGKGKGGLGESIPIGGYVVVKAYHADGQLYATWQGHNSLYEWAVSAIAECMSGQGSSPEGFDTCSGMTPNVWAYDDGTSEPTVTATATNTLLPAGCSTTSNPPTCTGWQSTGTIVFSASTPSGISYPYSVNQGGAAAQESYIPFDTVSISPAITANAGDSLVITVTFSIT